MSSDLNMAKQWIRQKNWHQWVDDEGNSMWMKSVGHWECWKFWLSRPQAEDGLNILSHQGRHVLDELYEHGGEGWGQEEWNLKCVDTWLSSGVRSELGLWNRLHKQQVSRLAFCQSVFLKKQLLPFLAYPAKAEEAEAGLSLFYGPALISWMGRYRWHVTRKDVRWKVAIWNILAGEEPLKYYQERWLSDAVILPHDQWMIRDCSRVCDKIQSPEMRQYFFKFFLEHNLEKTETGTTKKRL